MGGGLALRFAITHPHLVRALVLVSPAGAPLDAHQWRDFVGRFQVTDIEAAEDFLDKTFYRRPYFSRWVAMELRRRLRSPAVLQLLASTTASDFITPLELGAIKVPILLIWGRSDGLMPSCQVDWFQKHLPPHALLEQPLRYGHAPTLEYPGELSRRVIAFIRNQASGARG